MISAHVTLFTHRFVTKIQQNVKSVQFFPLSSRARGAWGPSDCIRLTVRDKTALTERDVPTRHHHSTPLHPTRPQRLLLFTSCSRLIHISQPKRLDIPKTLLKEINELTVIVQSRWDSWNPFNVSVLANTSKHKRTQFIPFFKSQFGSKNTKKKPSTRYSVVINLCHDYIFIC